MTSGRASRGAGRSMTGQDGAGDDGAGGGAGRDGVDERRAQPASLRQAVLAAVPVVGFVIGLAAAPGAAHAQFFQWPWSEQKPPVPHEPVHRPPPVPIPSPAPAPPPAATPGAPAAAPAPTTNWTQQRAPICIQLEQRLAQETQRGNPREQLPRIEGEIRQAEKNLRATQQQFERADCYEYFLFSKSLRRTRACIDLNGQVDAAKRQLSDLELQRQQIMGSGSRSYQDDIIRELARNNCGPGYAQEARRRDGSGSSVWHDDESSPGGAGNGGFGALPFATYRTVCVRLCDGYYFPISFSTTPANFQRDSDACQSKCAAPVELYFYQNPGGAVDQMTAFKSQEPYTRLKTAFRYRKELVQGCSCKTTEFIPQSPAPGAPPSDRRADASSAPPPAAPPAPASNSFSPIRPR